MNLRRWLSIVLALGLMVALCPINALAWRGAPFRPQFHQGFRPHQPWGHAYGWRGQRPPMYQHNRWNHRNRWNQGYDGRYYGYRHRYPDHQYNRYWMGQRNNYWNPYTQSGYQGYRPNPYYHQYGALYYGNGNTTGYWGGHHYQRGQSYYQPTTSGGTTYPTSRSPRLPVAN